MTQQISSSAVPVSTDLLLDTSATTQDAAARQFRIQQLTFWMTVVGILVVEHQQPSLSLSGYLMWLAVTLASWLVRVALFARVHRASPEEVARSPYLRFLPLVIVCIACAYWVWTIDLVSGPEITIKTIFLTIGLLNTTIAMTTMWFAAPIAVVVYNVCLWGALSFHLYVYRLAGIPELLALNATVVVVLWLFVVEKLRELRAETTRAGELESVSQNLRESNTKLQQMQSNAQHDLETRSGFFAEASHDFKQRLHSAKMVVLTARSLMLQKQATLDAVDRLGEEVDALESYIVNILNFARLEADKIKPRLKTVALQSVFQSMDVQFEAEAAAVGKEVRFRITGVKVATDRFMLERILGNLVSNALRFTRRRVLVAARWREGGIALEVWDQGPGLDESMREKIFEPFQQAPSREGDSKHWGGVGLGLAVVKNLSRQLHYEVSLQSRVGRGTVLRVWIPNDFIVR